MILNSLILPDINPYLPENVLLCTTLKTDMKKKITLIFILAALAMLMLMIPDLVIKNQTRDKLYFDSNKIPFNKVGLLLGTSKYVSRGKINLYYQYRINAAVELYRHHKIDFVLISGDNGQKEYNEPKTIKEDLVKAGIPANKIYSDYAGFRTWDSIIRAKKVFNQDSITVISQQFHNERAIFIGIKNQMNIVGFNAKDVSRFYGFKTAIREKFARINLMLDLLIHKKPKYLGPPITIQ